jgi:hypothetical protein
MEKQSFFSMVSSRWHPSTQGGKPGGDVREIIRKMIAQDHGIELRKKESLLTILNSPEAFDHILVGATGAAVVHALSSYNKMSPTARTLLSLAGFGIGNIMYNIIKERKFTSYDQETAKAKIKL